MTSGVVSGWPTTSMSGALEGICASIGCAPLRSSLIESADFVLVDVGLLLDARRVGAIHLVEIERRLVPQQRASGALRRFQIRVFFLQIIDELGDFGLVVIVLFAEHGRCDNRTETVAILPCLCANRPVGMAGRFGQIDGSFI